jgi:hypothetical protein
LTAAVIELEFAGVAPVGDELEPGDEQLADELGVIRAALSTQLLDQAVQLRA